MSLVIPNTIANGQSADGNEVGANFDAIETWAADVITKDGSVAMTGALTLAGSPSSNLEAATKLYVDSSLTSGLAAKCPVAKFTRTTDIALGALGGSDVHFESETNDTGGWWSSGNIVTVPSGLYVISAAVLSDGNGRLEATLSNGGTLNVAASQSLVGQNSTIHASAVAYFTTSTPLTVTVEEKASDSKTVRQVDLVICQLAVI